MEIPPGYYAVEDPDEPGRVTYWEVDARGVPRDYPAGARWRPVPPPGATKADKAHFYDRENRGPYFAWCDEIARRITADPAAAARRFQEKYPDPEPLPAARAPSGTVTATRTRQVSAEDVRAQIRRRVEALIVAALRESGGHSFRDIGFALGMPVSRCYRRFEAGKALAAASEQTINAQLAEYLRRLARLSDGDSQDGFLAAAAAILGSESAVPCGGRPKKAAGRLLPLGGGGTAATSRCRT